MFDECPDEQRLAEYVSGMLSDGEASEVESHLRRCRACESALATLENPLDPLIALLRGAPATDETSLLAEPDYRRGLQQLLDLRREPTSSTARDCSDDSVSRNSYRPQDVPGPPDTSRGGAAQETAVDLPEVPGYEILEVLGRGGMGLVVKARHLVLRRLVAIKLPLPSRMRDAEDRQRFLREARSVAHLQHANICPIYEVGETDGRPFLVMAFIAGESLEIWARRQALSPRQAAEIVAKLARAVSYAHAHGVIHRDIKPSNVMIDAGTGGPVLMDFGLAKMISEEDPQLTHSGQVMGTPVYMAPEQAAGRVQAVGRHSDVYALGVVLYELLCGRRPFSGSFAEVLQQVQAVEPPAPRRVKPGLHRDLETICLKAMAKESGARYAAAADLAEDLKRFCAGESILARREGIGRRLARQIRRHPLAAAGVLAVVLATAAIGWMSVRYADVNRLAAIRRELDGNLVQPVLTEEYLRTVETQIRQIQQLSPQQAQTDLARLYHGFAEAIRGELQQPVLEADDIQRLERAILRLGQRAPDTVSELTQALARRSREWQRIFDLTPNSREWAEILDPADVTVDKGQHLVLHRWKGDGQRPILTREACRGNVELAATFGAGWQSAAQIGLVLNCTEQGGYEFLLSLPRTTQPGSATPELALTASAGGTVEQMRIARLTIRRNGVLLDETRIPVSSLEGDRLLMNVTRAGNWLTCQLNNQVPIRHRDLFGLGTDTPGVFALHWAPGVPLVNLRAYRQALPVTPSLLERGDDLYLRGQFSEANDFYRGQSIASGSTAFGREARHKQALCLIALKRDAEAGQLLTSVVTEGEPGQAGGAAAEWWTLAACQLWLLRLRQHDFDEANAIFNRLEAYHRFEQLAAVIPKEVRTAIFSFYHNEGTGINVLLHNPHRIVDLERAVKVQELLGLPDLHTTRALIRAYRSADRIDKAVQVATRHVMAPATDELNFRDNLIDEYGWLMRDQGTPELGLKQLDRRLFESGGVIRRSFETLFVERARLHAAMQDWEEAAADLDQFFRLASHDSQPYHYLSGAHLMRGFLYRRAGDPERALQVWREGVRASGGSLPGRTATGEGSRMEQLHYLILASLTNQLSDSEAEALVQSVAEFQAAGSPVAILKGAVDLPAAVPQKMWQTDRGRQCAEQIAFQSVPWDRYIWLPLLLAGVELVHQKVFQDGFSSDQESLVWELGEQAYRQYFEGRLSATQIVQLALAWRGTTGAFGWAGVQSTLPGELRGPLAYVMGHRYLRLNRAPEAQLFFRTALDVAPPESALARLAEAELMPAPGKAQPDRPTAD